MCTLHCVDSGRMVNLLFAVLSGNMLYLLFDALSVNVWHMNFRCIDFDGKVCVRFALLFVRLWYVYFSMCLE